MTSIQETFPTESLFVSSRTTDYEEQLQKAYFHLSAFKGKPVAIDTETNGGDIRYDGYGMGIGVAYKNDEGVVVGHYFPFRHYDNNNYPQELLLELKSVLESAPFVAFHNAKFDLLSLETMGIDMFGSNWFCTMIMAHLINENYPYSKSLEACAQHYVSPELKKAKSEEFDQFAKAFGWHMIPVAMMREYGEYDPILTYMLVEKLFPLLERELDDFDYWRKKRRLIEVVARMEQRGVRIDTELCEQMIEKAAEEMGEALKVLGGLNPASPKDMEELFIRRLGLPVVKHTPGGKPSFDKFAVAVYDEILARQNNPLADAINSYRGWSKAASAFYRAYVTHVSSDGRLRPNYRHHKDADEGGTVTGRLSCANPNLQQIPRVSDKPWHGQVKKAFIPAEGYRLYEADFSQAELRLSAAYAKEQALLNVFEEGRDIFTEMSTTLNMSRNDTKTFVYSTQYGAGINRIKTVFGISEQQARQIRDNYHYAYPRLKALSDMCQTAVKRQGFLRIWSGRRRHFKNPQQEAHKAMNSLIQGGVADIVEGVMVRLWDEVDQRSNNEVRMLLQVHDSIVLEIKEGTEDKWLPIIKGVMSDVRPEFGVTFDVDVKEWGQ